MAGIPSSAPFKPLQAERKQMIELRVDKARQKNVSKH
jgi:hypothetical protein